MSKRPLCIVAGVGPGLGVAIARRFGREGFDVAMIARRQAELDSHAQDIAVGGVSARGYGADLCDLPGLAAAFGRIAADFGPAEVMVYNASLWRQMPAMQLDPDAFTWELQLCATGALACAQHVYPAMKAAGHGSILITGGGLALSPEYGAGVVGLTAGKAAVRGLAIAMAQELAPENIHVATLTVAGAIAPGTPFAPDLIAGDFITLHRQPKEHWQAERVFRGG